MFSVYLLVIIFNCLVNFTDCSCVVLTNSTRQPVYLKKVDEKYEFVVPGGNDGIHLQQGEKIYLLCAGHLNKLNQTNLNLTESVCVVNDRFLVSEQIYKFAELECRRSVRANVRNTDNICANGYVSYIGYYVENQFLKIIEVCYNNDLGSALYTRHVINYSVQSSSFGHNAPQEKPTFNTKGLSQENKSVSLVYYTAAQRAKLSSTLQSSIVANEMITNSSYLTRGQLTPSGDFTLISWQYSTFFFLNAVPLWTSIRNGNWKEIEYLTRKLGNRLEENLHVTTGVHEVLELPDRSGNLKPIYLSQRGKKFPVPRYVWKLVYAEKSRKAIVFVVVNNPHVKTEKLLCSSVCDSNGWGSDKWTKRHRGLIHCCNYSQFKQFVRNVPNVQVSGVLQGSSL